MLADRVGVLWPQTVGDVNIALLQAFTTDRTGPASKARPYVSTEKSQQRLFYTSVSNSTDQNSLFIPCSLIAVYKIVQRSLIIELGGAVIVISYSIDHQ